MCFQQREMREKNEQMRKHNKKIQETDVLNAQRNTTVRKKTRKPIWIYVGETCTMMIGGYFLWQLEAAWNPRSQRPNSIMSWSEFVIGFSCLLSIIQLILQVMKIAVLKL